MFKKIINTIVILSMSFAVSEDLTLEQKEQIDNQMLEEFAQAIFSKAMETKRAFRNTQTRESVIDNFATTAPRSEFIVNADIDPSLAVGVESATLYVSTDNQNSWQSANGAPIGTEGYENTWEGSISTSDGNSAYSYLSGVVDSEVLGESFGTMLVSNSPHNVNGNWPPSSSLYATLANDPTGDTSSDFDITTISGTYLGSEEIDSEGNTYTDVERFYLKMSLNGGCCEEGGLFGPWYLYGIGIVNPESEEAVAYAIGYGNGGFGQLTPGLLKITGDLESGAIDGFEYLTTNISYNISGSDLQATALMSYVTSDSQWGTWPNSYNGFIALGVTVEAALDGIDVAADIKDQTDPGLFICATQYQDGNIPLVLSNPSYDETTNTMSVLYADADGNLPWFKAAQICNTPENGGNCFTQLNMIPDSHDYENGSTFSASISDNIISEYDLSGDYEAHFWFADDDIENYPAAQIEIPINVGGGSCPLAGDSNGDGTLNVLDVVLLVNLVLEVADADECSDINGDGSLNVLDVVLLVNLVLGGMN